MISAHDLIGKTVGDERYVISGVLGEGSQGSTLDAIDKTDGTRVAIKRFAVRGARSWKDVELAEREARVLSSVSHPLLPRALGHFEQDGALYLVMERVEGQPLHEIERSSRADVIRFLLDADRVLAYLHGRAPPIIHRDIKPANVIRRPTEGRSEHVLVDFGSVRDSLKPAAGSTVVGTFGYMAPEQFQGRALPQSDVYAVGATALRLLTGQEPETLPHKGLAIDVAAALPNDPAMARVLAQLLEPDPDKRPSRILPLLAALQPGAAPKRDRAEVTPPPAPARYAQRYAERDRRREEQRAHKRARRDERRQRRRSQRSGRSNLPPLVLPIVVIALTIARLAVNLSLRVFVPTLLSLLALLFGDRLRQAAHAVSRAGVVADGAIGRATERVTGSESHAPSEAASGPAGQRIDADVSRAGARIAEPVPSAYDEVEAAVREAAAELEALRSPKKRHKRP